MRYKFKGCNDDTDTCDLCGKTGLKKVVWLVEVDENGEEMSSPAPYETCCAAKLLGIKGPSRDAKTEIKAMDLEYKKALWKELETKIWTRINEIVKENGLVLVSGDYFFSEDVEAARTIHGLERIRLVKRVREQWPVMVPTYCLKDLQDRAALL